MKDLIQKMDPKGKLIAIRLVEHAWDEYTVGYFLEVKSRSIVIDEIDENGCSIGSLEIPFASIIGLDINDRYLRRLERIGREFKNAIDNQGVYVHRKDDNFWNEIMIIERKGKIATFYFDNDSYATGILIDMPKKTMSFRSIGIEGDEDGMSYRLINNLTGFRYDSAFENRIEFIYRNARSFYS